MSDILGVPYVYVDNAAAMERLLQAMGGAQRAAFDTEGDSLYHYFEKVCLMQLSVGGVSYIIDPLAGLDMSGFLEALGGVRLVVHGGDYDLRMMRASFGFMPGEEIFDTMLAAQLLGYEEMGLVALTDRFFEAGLSKKGQKSDWSVRPLPEKMLAYASKDVHYLEPLADRLAEELAKAGRLEWHRESCRYMVKSTERRNRVEPDREWRIKGVSTFGRRQLAFVRELWYWREEEARGSDLPPFRILGNQVIATIAKWAANPKGSAGCPKLPRHFTGRRLESFKEALRRARAMPKEQRPQPPARGVRRVMEAGQRDMVERLRKEVGKLAENLGLDAAVVAPKAAVRSIANQRPGSVEEIMACGMLTRWQAELILPIISEAGGVRGL